MKKLKETYDMSIFRNPFVFWTLKIQISRRWKIFKCSLFSNSNGQNMYHNLTKTSNKNTNYNKVKTLDFWGV